jgi:hypothetical protein
MDDGIFDDAEIVKDDYMDEVIDDYCIDHG